MKSKALIFSVAALASFATLNAQDQSASSSASAGTEKHHGSGHHHEFGYFLKQYFSDNKQTFRSDVVNLLKAKQTVNSAIEKNPGDDATIRSLSVNVASARTELTAQRAKFDVFLTSILTSEQKQTLAALQQKRDTRMQNRINHLSQSAS
jgi:Spy/CpxP family protein refolding chaperone